MCVRASVRGPRPGRGVNERDYCQGRSITPLASLLADSCESGRGRFRLMLFTVNIKVTASVVHSRKFTYGHQHCKPMFIGKHANVKSECWRNKQPLPE